MQSIQIRLTKKLIEKAQKLVDADLYSNKSEVIRDALRRLTFDELKTKNKPSFNILFTADIHGNIKQYEKLFQKAQSENINAVIIGGDIAPKDPAHRTIRDQKEFLERKLFPAIKKFRKNNQHCKVYLMLGNDDFRSNINSLRENEKDCGFISIHGKCIRFHEDFKIIGYSYVPLTPFIHKDWEKLDLKNKDETLTRGEFRRIGNKARGKEFVEVKFNLKKRTDTIENDLKSLFQGVEPKRTILVSHAPPYGTCLDMVDADIHVGSEAIMKLIKDKQPYLTLHGHIHETVEISGNFKELIKKTISACAGNDHIGPNLKVLRFNLYEPERAIREII